MIDTIFRSDVVRRRMARSHLGIILHDFVLDLQRHGYALTCIHSYSQLVEHFSRWLATRRIRPRQIDEPVVERFLRRHLPQCRCPKPAPTQRRNCRAGLGRLVVFLRQRRVIPEKPAPELSEIDRLVLEYDSYLGEIAGVAPTTRQYRCRYAREFLQTRLSRKDGLRLWNILPSDLIRHVHQRAPGLKPSSLRVLTGALRDFLRFLCLTGRGEECWIAAVPHPASWPRSSLPEILSDEQVRGFMRSFDRSTPTGRRDYAMAACLIRLGLRTQEVATLTLDDLDFDSETVRLRQTKQGRERLLPLPRALVQAITSYIHRGRPATGPRGVFVRHRAPVGQALQVHHVRGAMRRALARSGMGAVHVHLLRHTFATRLHRRGVGLKAIADLLGHLCLDTTARYARVNLEELRQAALPWPERWR
jgi:site-specific recombinase XerD